MRKFRLPGKTYMTFNRAPVPDGITVIDPNNTSNVFQRIYDKAL